MDDGGLVRAAKYGDEILGRVISPQVPVAALVEIRIGIPEFDKVILVWYFDIK